MRHSYGNDEFMNLVQHLRHIDIIRVRHANLPVTRTDMVKLRYRSPANSAPI
jgi:hypothetical protein